MHILYTHRVLHTLFHKREKECTFYIHVITLSLSLSLSLSTSPGELLSYPSQ